MPYIQVEQNVNFFIETCGTGKPIEAIHGWPAFIMHGTADKVWPFRVVETLHREIKNATLMESTKSGHGLLFMKKKRK